MTRELAGVCLITDDVRRLAGFYALVLERPGEVGGDFASFASGAPGGVTLSICAAGVMESLAPGSTAGTGNGRVVVELAVDDVDVEHVRLSEAGVPVVKPPTTQPWGLRSVWFRDPDGNVVNLFARVAG